jgi:hypothetical protein
MARPVAKKNPFGFKLDHTIDQYLLYGTVKVRIPPRMKEGTLRGILRRKKVPSKVVDGAVQFIHASRVDFELTAPPKTAKGRKKT